MSQDRKNAVPTREKPSCSYHSPQNKIDVHHHAIPDVYRQAIAEAGGDGSGVPYPKWSPEDSLASMTTTRTRMAILSVAAPGPTIAGSREKASRLARALNVAMAETRDKYPENFGFFASVPSVIDTHAALEEIAYSLDTLKADGVILMTHYVDENSKPVYLGHSLIKAIWGALNARQAVVFIHPALLANLHVSTPGTVQPLIEFPHETTRTAVDMILNNVKRDFPNVKVILCHAGGTLPYIIPRVAYLAPSFGDTSATLPQKTTEEIMEDFRSFWFDTTLAGTATTVDELIRSVGADRILFGSDVPFAPPAVVTKFTDALEQVKMSAEVRSKINHKNAVKLFPRLAGCFSDT